MKFVVKGTISVEVTATIDAESPYDAESQFDSADCCVDCCDENITFDDCSQSGSDVDEVSCPAYDKWEKSSYLERAFIMSENGVSHETAYESAQLDFNELEVEWQEFFD